MFNQLSDRLTQTINKMRGISQLTENNIQEALKEVRRALLEADVALPAVNQFIEHVQSKAIGQSVIRHVRPADAFIKVVQDELTHILGDQQAELNLQAPSPIIFLVAGLQGSGKTTTVAKLAYWLRTEKKKSILITSCDVYRPAAIDQLRTLAEQAEVNFFPSESTDSPRSIVQNAITAAKKQFADILIIDTAGRLHIDEELMNEIRDIHTICTPTETLLVVDSMAGQDAANIAQSFNQALELTGIILTKTDGDARGGAALSMRIITGKPIKFIGVGEKLDAIEPFHPDRIASRILGMGDIVSLVEEAQRKFDHTQASKMAEKLKKGSRFDYNDFLTQLEQMKKMGGTESLLSKLPGIGQIPQAAKAMLSDKQINQMKAIIQSMTPQERTFPAVMNGARKKRIARGSGTTLQDVAKLINQFAKMQKMMKRFKGDKMMKQLKQLSNQFPGFNGKFPLDF